MEPVPATVPQPPQNPIPRKPEMYDHTRSIFLAIVLPILIAAVAYGVYIYWKQHPSETFFLNTKVSLQSSNFPLIAAQDYDGKTKKLSPVNVEGQGTASVVGIAAGSEHRYYLLSSDGRESNVFTLRKDNPKTGLTQRTFSHTAKVTPSYDEQSDTLAYAVVSPNASSSIVILTNGTSTEKILGVGNNPTLLKGGFFVVYQKEDQLVSANTATGEVHMLLTIPKGGAFAVDGKGLRAVIYEPATNMLQYFSLAGMIGASYQSSEKLNTPRTSHLLTLSGKELVDAIQTDKGLVFVSGDSKSVHTNQPIDYPAALLTIIHE